MYASSGDQPSTVERAIAIANGTYRVGGVVSGVRLLSDLLRLHLHLHSGCGIGTGDGDGDQNELEGKRGREE